MKRMMLTPILVVDYHGWCFLLRSFSLRLLL
ncbi:Uncharacterised protein [Budvicia aquatica]|uniref:Uncharacterized protein n=1 Tax=Budvicia aquatica TaxID=82979 RepID=A0A484ZKR8_9GAMM|nr:Uncharacterised protein [Budvicia aquatica]